MNRVVVMMAAAGLLAGCASDGTHEGFRGGTADEIGPDIGSGSGNTQIGPGAPPIRNTQGTSGTGLGSGQEASERLQSGGGGSSFGGGFRSGLGNGGAGDGSPNR